MSSKSIYVLGTCLSHDGSACLLKDGKICVAIEKERLTRNKHDGFNDTDAIKYCLDAEGITLTDLSLVVQNANFGAFEFGNSFFGGKRLFSRNLDIPIVTISHHLAHCYYALGTSPYKETAILVLDGCGSLFDECIDLTCATVVPQSIPEDIKHLYAEKDSLYIYKDNELKPVFKDFSPLGLSLKSYPMHPQTTKHSIGGLYAAVAQYCLGNLSDTGKLMGLGPYGKPDTYSHPIFEMDNGRVFVSYDWMRCFDRPVITLDDFWADFQYYADIAYWVQRETERAILYLVNWRRRLVDVSNLSYTGGVALNALVNAQILNAKIFDNVFFTPAAGDNGLAIGCAYYGWMQVLKNERVIPNGTSFFGKCYPHKTIKEEISNFIIPDISSLKFFAMVFFNKLPDRVKKEKLSNKEYSIQITIPEIGLYFVSMTKDGVFVLNNSKRKPNCFLYVDANIFVQTLRGRRIPEDSIKNKKSFVSGDLDYFFNAIEMDDLVRIALEEVKRNGMLRKVQFSEQPDVAVEAAKLLAEGKVIAWYQEGCEFGPRALGHRSILADPGKPGVRNFINNRIKLREDFRPFAPAVLREEVSEYFEFSGDSPHMILIMQAKRENRDRISEVVHVDGSSRIQTVTKEWNEEFYGLLTEFRKQTGLPVLLNTSLNRKGMPIIETPAEALQFFYESDLDCLVIGKFIVTKE